MSLIWIASETEEPILKFFEEAFMAEDKKEDKKETTRVSKGRDGYGYKYTELAQINELLEKRGESYYQYTESFGEHDYIMTVKVNKDGKESAPLRGCRIISENSLKGNGNPAQQMGSAITYARRYSLLMAYGLATEDDDAASAEEQKQGKPQTQNRTQSKSAPAPQPKPTEKMITPDDERYIYDVVNRYPGKNLMDQIRNKYHVDNLSQMTEKQSKNCVALLNEFESNQHPTA